MRAGPTVHDWIWVCMLFSLPRLPCVCHVCEGLVKPIYEFIRAFAHTFTHTHTHTHLNTWLSFGPSLPPPSLPNQHRASTQHMHPLLFLRRHYRTLLDCLGCRSPMCPIYLSLLHPNTRRHTLLLHARSRSVPLLVCGVLVQPPKCMGQLSGSACRKTMCGVRWLCGM